MMRAQRLKWRLGSLEVDGCLFVVMKPVICREGYDMVLKDPSNLDTFRR
jgi:hypothetical protein